MSRSAVERLLRAGSQDKRLRTVELQQLVPIHTSSCHGVADILLKVPGCRTSKSGLVEKCPPHAIEAVS